MRKIKTKMTGQVGGGGGEEEEGDGGKQENESF